jgi:hypothetical protein
VQIPIPEVVVEDSQLEQTPNKTVTNAASQLKNTFRTPQRTLDHDLHADAVTPSPNKSPPAKSGPSFVYLQNEGYMADVNKYLFVLNSIRRRFQMKRFSAGNNSIICEGPIEEHEKCLIALQEFITKSNQQKPNIMLVMLQMGEKEDTTGDHNVLGETFSHERCERVAPAPWQQFRFDPNVLSRAPYREDFPSYHPWDEIVQVAKCVPSTYIGHLTKLFSMVAYNKENDDELRCRALIGNSIVHGKLMDDNLTSSTLFEYRTDKGMAEHLRFDFNPILKKEMVDHLELQASSMTRVQSSYVISMYVLDNHVVQGKKHTYFVQCTAEDQGIKIVHVERINQSPLVVDILHVLPTAKVPTLPAHNVRLELACVTKNDALMYDELSKWIATLEFDVIVRTVTGLIDKPQRFTAAFVENVKVDTYSDGEYTMVMETNSRNQMRCYWESNTMGTLLNVGSNASKLAWEKGVKYLVRKLMFVDRVQVARCD